MSAVRPLEASDIHQVASMFQRIFRNSKAEPPPAFVAYLKQLYLESPGCDPDIQPLVHLSDDGKLSGFIGVNALPMTFEGKKLRAAICGSLMVEDRGSYPMAGARLLKTFLDGPQDLSFSETASEVSAQMWTSLRGIALPGYSLDWVRIIRPAAFMLDLASQRFGAVSMLAPAARGLDRYLRDKMERNARRWSAVPTDFVVHGGATISQIDQQGFADLVNPLTARFPLRPDWAEGQLAYILSDAAKKPEHGEAVFAVVKAPRGTPVGAFLYHSRPGGIARVLQILAGPGLAGTVLDCLIADASARGAAGLRGRTHPALLEAMLGRRIAFINAASTVIHCRDNDILRAFHNGEAFVNGLAGEHWARLIGGRFD